MELLINIYETSLHCQRKAVTLGFPPWESQRQRSLQAAFFKKKIIFNSLQKKEKNEMGE